MDFLAPFRTALGKCQDWKKKRPGPLHTKGSKTEVFFSPLPQPDQISQYLLEHQKDCKKDDVATQENCRDGCSQSPDSSQYANTYPLDAIIALRLKDWLDAKNQKSGYLASFYHYVAYFLLKIFLNSNRQQYQTPDAPLGATVVQYPQPSYPLHIGCIDASGWQDFHNKKTKIVRDGTWLRRVALDDQSSATANPPCHMEVHLEDKSINEIVA